MLLFGLFCGCRGFCHRTESDLFLFLLVKHLRIMKHLSEIRHKDEKQIYCTGTYLYIDIRIYEDIDISMNYNAD